MTKKKSEKMDRNSIKLCCGVFSATVLHPNDPDDEILDPKNYPTEGWILIKNVWYLKNCPHKKYH